MKELALQYYPHHADPKYAGQCLRRTIKGYPELFEELTEANWKSSNANLTPRQEEIIIRFLGNPRES